MHHPLRDTLGAIALLAASGVVLGCSSSSTSASTSTAAASSSTTTATGAGGGSGGAGGATGGGGSTGSGGATAAGGAGGATTTTAAGGAGGAGGTTTTSAAGGAGGGANDYCPAFTGSCNVVSASQCADVDASDASAVETACKNAGGVWSASDHCPAKDKAFGCLVQKNLLEPTATCKVQWYYAPLNQPGSGSFICPAIGGTAVTP
jgi:two-component system chemotaxis sensor kinase CheA